MSARDTILGKIKSHLDQSTDPTVRAWRGEVVRQPAPNLIPERGDDKQGHLVDRFVAEAERVNASIARVSSYNNVPDAVSSYLRDKQLPAAVRLAPDPTLVDLAWKTETSLMVEAGRTDGSDPVSVSKAFAGVAETGTLVLTSSAESPTSLNFLPLDHIVVLEADKISGNYESVWAKIREKAVAEGAPGSMPRTVNWVTGPSRTADIEQTLLLGAHGPQRLHIILVDPSQAA